MKLQAVLPPLSDWRWHLGLIEGLAGNAVCCGEERWGAAAPPGQVGPNALTVARATPAGTALYEKDAETSLRDIEATLLVCAQQHWCVHSSARWMTRMAACAWLPPGVTAAELWRRMLVMQLGHPACASAAVPWCHLAANQQRQQRECCRRGPWGLHCSAQLLLLLRQC
jgi:hypothetical protein